MGISIKTHKSGFTTSVVAKIDTLSLVHAIVIQRLEAFVVPILIMGIGLQMGISIKTQKSGFTTSAMAKIDTLFQYML